MWSSLLVSAALALLLAAPAEAPDDQASLPEEAPKEALSSEERWRQLAPRMLFLDPEFAPDLKLDGTLRLEVKMSVKNALRREGSYRVRTIEDVEIDDEGLHGELLRCVDDECLYRALNDTTLGQFIRTRISAAPKGGLRVQLRAHRVAEAKAAQRIDFVVHPDPAVGDLGEVLLRRLRLETLRTIYTLPPAPMLDGIAPAADSAMTILAPDGSSILINGEAAGEVLEMGMLRLERSGGQDYLVRAQLAGHQEAKATVKLRPGEAVFVALEPVRNEEAKDEVTEAPQRFGAISVRMKVKPGADVYLDGRWIGENPLVFKKCPKGRHRVTIRHPLYYRLWREIQCAPGVTARVAAEMLPKYGRVQVTSAVKGVGVLFDGDPVGRTPLMIDEVPSGKHTVQLLDETWQSREVRFKLVEHRTERFNLAVSKRFGVVEVLSSTEGLVASAQGRKLRIEGGRGLLKVPPGKSKVSCRAPFHATVHQFVRVGRGRQVRLRCDLEAVSARLVVDAAGTAGRVVVDGRAVSRLPAEVAIQPGKHRVVVEPDDQAFQPFIKEIEVANKAVVRLKAEFARLVGGLEVKSEPAGAMVLLDGKDFGKTPLYRKDIPVGVYSLTVRKKGSDPFHRRVVIAEGEKAKVNAQKLRQRGLLKVSTPVPGATIIVGGVEMGKTPAVLDDLPSGLYEVEARRKGFSPRILEVEVENGKSQKVAFRRLVPEALLGAAFYRRVPGGGGLLFGGASAVAIGLGARYLGGNMVSTSPEAAAEANSRRSIDGAVSTLEGAHRQAAAGELIEGTGFVMIGAGATALSWFALRFPWGDL